MIYCWPTYFSVIKFNRATDYLFLGPEIIILAHIICIKSLQMKVWDEGGIRRQTKKKRKDT